MVTKIGDEDRRASISSEAPYTTPLILDDKFPLAIPRCSHQGRRRPGLLRALRIRVLPSPCRRWLATSFRLHQRRPYSPPEFQWDVLTASSHCHISAGPTREVDTTTSYLFRGTA